MAIYSRLGKETCKKLGISARSAQEAGFSLVEICIVLLIISLLIVPTLQLYRTYIKNLHEAQTKQAVDSAAAALTKYALKYGVYPYPASPGSVLGSATFGRPATKPGGGWPDCQNVATPLTDVCKTTLNTYGGHDVLIGVIPFAELGVPISMTLDENGNQLTYAITEDLTNSLTFSEDRGGIEVIRSDGKSYFFIDTNSDGNDDLTVDRAQFAVVSHGIDARGGTSQGGTIALACGTNADSTDFENCNRDGKFRNNVDPTTQKTLSFLATGATYFDDYVVAMNTTSSGMWSNTPVATSTILGVRDRLGGNIAIGNCGGRSPCVPVSQLDVYGAVRASGAVKAARFIARGPESQGSSWYAPDDYSLVENASKVDARCTKEGYCPPAAANSWSTTNIPPFFTPQMIGGIPAAIDETSPFWVANGGSHGPFLRGNGIRCIKNMGLNGIFDNDEACNDTSYAPAATITQTGQCPTGEYAQGLNANGSLNCMTPAMNP